MTSGTVVVLPTTDARHSSARGALLAAGFHALGIDVAAEPLANQAARICAALSADPPAEPLTIVAFGASALLLPSIALAQRTAHRRVREYVLVDPQIPSVSDGWPDAHVTVFADNERPQARLRGWDVRPLAALALWTPMAD